MHSYGFGKTQEMHANTRQYAQIQGHLLICCSAILSSKCSISSDLSPFANLLLEEIEQQMEQMEQMQQIPIWQAPFAHLLPSKSEQKMQQMKQMRKKHGKLRPFAHLLVAENEQQMQQMQQKFTHEPKCDR